MAKNKQKNGQRLNAKKLLTRCNELEDAVVSQQKTIGKLESQIINDALAHALAKKRYEDAIKYLELNRPEILQLMKVHAKHGILAANGKLPSVTVKLVKGKHKAPRIPESSPTFKEVEQENKAPILGVQPEQIHLKLSGKMREIPIEAPPGPKGLPEVWDQKERKFITQKKEV